MSNDDYKPSKIAIHSKHIVHYWIGHKSGKYMSCACGYGKYNGRVFPLDYILERIKYD